MSGQTFKTMDVLRLEVENTPTGLVNALQNPSGELGGWGWITPNVGSVVSDVDYRGVGGYRWLRYYASGVPGFYSEPFLISAGQYVAARWDQAQFDASNTAYTKVRFEWIDASGTITASTQSGYLTSGNLTSGLNGSGNALSYAAVQAPAGTVKARLRFDVYNNTSGAAPIGNLYLRRVTVAKASTAGALTGLGYLDPATYTNVLGPTHSLTIKREELNVGTLTAEILDATLDPAQADLIRPGKRVRVMALDAATWKPLFVGKVSNGNVVYDLKRTDEKQARITLTAIDAASQLAQTPRSEGVGTISELRAVLEGSGVPWDFNYLTGHYGGTPTYVSSNDNASALDQVAITRDSRLGYAWVSREGVVRGFDPDQIPTALAATLDESAYSDLNADYDTDRLINVVNVKLRRSNIATGQTVEVTYGPFTNEASVAQWGPHLAEFTVHGITDTEAAAKAYADLILAANATPAVRVNSLAIPIRSTSDLTPGRALTDLYDLVSVEFGDPIEDLLEDPI